MNEGDIQANRVDGPGATTTGIWNDPQAGHLKLGTPNAGAVNGTGD